jgi:flagella basal body P-ring formation protein FlgA
MRIIILSLLGLMLISNASATVNPDTPELIKQAASRFLDEFVATSKSENLQVDYSLGHLDSRLKLSNCPQGPVVSFSSDPFETTHPTLLVACAGDRPWRLFISTELTIEGTGLVASRPLSRGARIGQDMVSEQPVTINASRRRAITDREALVGMELRRAINAGTAFTPDLLNEPDAVTRGDHVVIVAKVGSIAVESRGKALADGKVGEQVTVKNLASSRTLRAKIIEPGRVEVPM